LASSHYLLEWPSIFVRDRRDGLFYWCL